MEDMQATLIKVVWKYIFLNGFIKYIRKKFGNYLQAPRCLLKISGEMQSWPVALEVLILQTSF